jgi:hypothetical protein
MITGVDASQDCSSIGQTLVNQGRQFVCRYYANSGKKRLSTNEAQTLSSAGLKIVVVWEDGRPTSPSYFSFTKGVDDGTSAYNDALQIGQPAGTPIYFAIDYDASSADLAGVINDYFNGITQGLKLASRNNMEHPVGVYGSGATCSFILKRGLATYSWLAMSSGWQGNNFPDWNIRQSDGTTYSGIAVDFDESNNDSYGGFTL